MQQKFRLKWLVLVVSKYINFYVFIIQKKILFVELHDFFSYNKLRILKTITFNKITNVNLLFNCPNIIIHSK
jgi:hypothetical protein